VKLVVEPLTRAAFAPFGEVIEAGAGERRVINAGYAVRWHDLARVDVTAEAGAPVVSIFEALPRGSPIAITMMERHPLASQAFVPMEDRDWFIVVATADAPLAPAALRAFRASGRQGVNYGRNVWHHPLLVAAPQRFVVVDRDGPGDNLVEAVLTAGVVLEI
jgi:ureidoglycolate lyase